MIPCLVPLFLLISLVEAATEKGFPDYNPQVYPDSQLDFGICRLVEPSLVCDPNSLLNEHNGEDGVLSLHKVTQHVMFNTQCACGSVTYGSCIHRTRGFPISIAVLKKIRGSPDKKDNSAELIEAFAKVLRRRLKRGQCEDDVLIVYSVEDAQVFTVVGSVARRKLDPKVVAEVENLARSKHFNNGNYTGGLLLMVDIFGRIFLGENYNEALPVNEGGFSNGLKRLVPRWPNWVTVSLIVGLPALVILLILICAVFFAVRRYYSRTQHYEAGRRRDQ